MYISIFTLDEKKSVVWYGMCIICDNYDHNQYSKKDKECWGISSVGRLRAYYARNPYFTLEVMLYQIQFLHKHLIHSPNLMPNTVSFFILCIFSKTPLNCWYLNKSIIVTGLADP